MRPFGWVAVWIGGELLYQFTESNVTYGPLLWHLTEQDVRLNCEVTA